MEESIADRQKAFDAKKVELTSKLEKWFEDETASIDGTVVASAPAGTGGSIVSKRPAIDSKRVVDATVITIEVLGIELPPEIIKPGGYESCEEMINDIVPKLAKVFTGETKVKNKKPTKKPEPQPA